MARVNGKPLPANYMVQLKVRHPRIGRSVSELDALAKRHLGVRVQISSRGTTVEIQNHRTHPGARCLYSCCYVAWIVQ
jgi:hypothetical protein